MPDGMSINPDDLTAATKATADAKRIKEPREVSSIGFPYITLREAIKVAYAILEAGGVPLARDQLAAKLGLQVGSGNFTNKTAAARLFGLIETVAGKYQLSRLGFDILDKDEKRVRTAKVASFLNVPLYRRAYDEFRNGQLPPRPLGLENAFANFGVSSKQTDKARRVFDNSARQAGFFVHGTDRLIAPPVEAGGSSALRDATPEKAPNVKADVPSEPQDILAAAQHPFVNGLLMALPKRVGDTWNTDKRIDWLEAAAKVFDLMFSGGDKIVIAAERAPRPRVSRKRDDTSNGETA